MCDVNAQNISKQMHVYWKNEHFQTLLKKSSNFVVCQQNVVLLNYIYNDLQKGDFSEINQFFQEIKKNMSNLA